MPVTKLVMSFNTLVKNKAYSIVYQACSDWFHFSIWKVPMKPRQDGASRAEIARSLVTHWPTLYRADASNIVLITTRGWRTTLVQITPSIEVHTSNGVCHDVRILFVTFVVIAHLLSPIRLAKLENVVPNTLIYI